MLICDELTLIFRRLTFFRDRLPFFCGGLGLLFSGIGTSHIESPALTFLFAATRAAALCRWKSLQTATNHQPHRERLFPRSKLRSSAR